MPQDIIIRGADKVLLPQGFASGVDVWIRDGNIAAVGSGLHTGAKTVDGTGCVLAPGFVDIHIHGAAGMDALDEDGDSLRAIAAMLVRHGVTTFLPTAMTAPVERIAHMIRRVAVYRDEDSSDIPGCHLEGPFFGPECRGAQPLDMLRTPDDTVWKTMVGEHAACVLRLAVDPTLPGAHEFIRKRAAEGIRVAIGHTAANHDQAVAAMACGARQITHLFNGMKPWHHREPGVPGAAISQPGVQVELISDGVHVHPAMVKTVWQAVGTERVAMISDAIAVAGMSDGEYPLHGDMVTVTGGEARLKSGSLAGSTCLLDEAVRRMAGFGFAPEDVLRMASSTPSGMAGLKDRGVIAAGMRGDVVLLDASMGIRSVYVAGVCRFQA